MSKPRLVGLLVFIQFILLATFFSVRRSGMFRDDSQHQKSGSQFIGSAGHQQINNESSVEQIWPPAADGFLGAIIAAARETSDMRWIERVRDQKYGGTSLLPNLALTIPRLAAPSIQCRRSVQGRAHSHRHPQQRPRSHGLPDLHD